MMLIIFDTDSPHSREGAKYIIEAMNELTIRFSNKSSTSRDLWWILWDPQNIKHYNDHIVEVSKRPLRWVSKDEPQKQHKVLRGLPIKFGLFISFHFP